MENKINDISTRAETCNTCYQLVEDELSNTYVSMKEENSNKVNSIPSIHINKFIKKISNEDGSDKFNSNKKDDNIKFKYSANFYNELPINENSEKKLIGESLKFNNNLNTFNNLINNSITLNTFTDEKQNNSGTFLNFNKNTLSKINNDEDNILDENAGGMEYYKYLERTVIYNFFVKIILKHEDIQSNVQKLDNEYENKSKILIDEIEVI